jgi:hypothetical protein
MIQNFSQIQMSICCKYFPLIYILLEIFGMQLLLD